MKISIITINLNNKNGLVNTINSVTSQVYAKIEYIIIDGGSTDGSIDIIREREKSISYWISESDNGIYDAMNKGILKSTGDFCLFLNSGDFLVNDKVLSDIFSTKHDSDILIGDCKITKSDKVVFTAQQREKITLKAFYKKTIPHQSTFIRRQLFNTLGLYNNNYVIHGDYDFWLRAIICHNCSVENLDIIVSNYNLEGISSNEMNKSISEREMQEIIAKYIPQRVLQDYDKELTDKEELIFFYWIKSKAILYVLIKFIFQISAVILKMIKRK